MGWESNGEDIGGNKIVCSRQSATGRLNSIFNKKYSIMKILYYSPHPHLNLMSPSGYGTHMREMINAFKVIGHKVLPVIIGGTELNNTKMAIPKPSFIKKLLKSIIPALIWESAKDVLLIRNDMQAKKLLEQKVKAFQPDLIYERSSYLQSSGVEVANKYNIEHILEINAPYTEERIKLQGYSLFIKKAEKIE